MDNDFYSWFLKTWKETEGFVSPSDASRLLGVSRQNFNNYIIRGKIKKYTFNGSHSFVSLKDVVFLKEKEKSRKNVVSVESKPMQEDKSKA